MTHHDYTFEAILWLYPGKAGWTFVTVPQDVSSQIASDYAYIKRGWGSLPVRVTIAGTTWDTSLFPDKQSQSYLLPVKSSIRKAAHIAIKDALSITLRVREE